MLSKNCFSKVVAEVATLVDVDKAMSSWEYLEYTLLQVRLLKSCKAELSKGFPINGQIYNINIVEEVVNQGEENVGASIIIVYPRIVYRRWSPSLKNQRNPMMLRMGTREGHFGDWR